ncbi:MAG: HAMP domain-containing protein, partial [Clostridia bacterium]|nr:HAMP domain-containing protein [Clostridia bacterium]
MKIKKGGKLFRKYLINMFALIIIGLLIMSVLFLAIETTRWKNEQTKILSNDTAVVAESIEDLISNFASSSYNGSIPVFVVSNTLDALCTTGECDIFICDMDGKVIFCREMTGQNQSGRCLIHSQYKIPEDVIQEASENGYNKMTTLDGNFSIQNLVVASPIKTEKGTAGIVFATKPVVGTWGAYVLQIAKIMLAAAAVTLFISFFIIYGMVYRITKPLREMSKATKLYAQGDFSYKVTVKGDDEMAELAQAFNKMASSLAALESSRRSFVGNVSHELKTPMTTIGGFIDGVLDGTIPPEQEKHYLKIVSDEVKRLARLVTAMLNMTKLEAGEMQLNPKEFDLSQDIFNTLLTFEKIINSKSLQILGLDTMSSLIVNADEDMIMQVIYNLIDNAIKFTPEGGYILFK